MVGYRRAYGEHLLYAAHARFYHTYAVLSIFCVHAGKSVAGVKVSTGGVYGESMT